MNSGRTRREWLLRGSAWGLAVPWTGGIAANAPAITAASSRLAAAWDDAQGRHFAGVLQAHAGTPLRVQHAIELPTRAHGLTPAPDGSLLVFARRPGEWLLRWQPGQETTRPPRWQWTDAERRYSGHGVISDGRLYTTEADLDSGAGRVRVRDARSLAVIDDWPSHGIDAHQLMIDADGSLLVANGGVPTAAETGRVKLRRDSMDPSLARLSMQSGHLLGQWRLDDRRLSIRHLARHAGGTIGIALQAEHDDAADRDAAPLLALFDGRTLRCVPQPQALAGYAGDIAATAGGFALAATRAGGIARWAADGRWQALTPLAEACPLAMNDDELWAGGRTAVLQGAESAVPAAHTVAALRLDNHWIAWPGRLTASR
jgi:uncharacterized protein